MSNKFILAALLAAVSSVALAGPTVADLNSINAELKMQELQNKLDEAKAKGKGLTEGPASTGAGMALPPVAPVSAAPVAPITALAGASIESEDIKLLAIYGVGKNLKAEVLYNGNSFTLSKGSEQVKLGSWTITDITPERLILSQGNDEAGDGKGDIKGKGKGKAKGKEAKREVYLSSSSSVNGDTRNLNLYASPSGQGPSNGQMPPGGPQGSYVPVPLPPITPVLPVPLPATPKK